MKVIERISQFYYDTVKGLKNLWVWLPIIWNDRDWDQHYIYKVFSFKLKKQANAIEKWGCHLYKERDVRQMRNAAHALDRLAEDDYLLTNVYQQKLDREFGRLGFVTRPGGEEEYDGSYWLRRERVQSEADERRERFLILKSGKHEQYLRRQDLEYFGRIFSRHSPGWWD